MTTILVVDDEPDLEALMLQKFRRERRDGTLAFVFARDGVEALAQVALHPGLDLVLADINMPRMDGLTLLAHLQDRADPPATVIVSAYGDMANIRTAMNRGAFDFLTKPIDFADLEATMAKTLRHVAARREAEARRIAAEQSQAAMARYFSPNLAHRLAGQAQGLEGQRRVVTAIFTDVAGFTPLAETLAPEALGRLLNAYLGAMTDIVFAHGGTVTKIIGDGMLLLFGAPDDQPDHAARAVACALALDAFAEVFRTRMSAEGVAFGATRIGLHTGPALVGDFGSGRHFDYTAYGDTINVASRLEGANKRLGTRICASGSVALGVAGFQGRPVGDLLLRGRTDALAAWQPVTADVAAHPATRAYLDAYAAMRAGAAGAAEALAALGDDPLAVFHRRRLAAGGQGVAVDLR